MLLNLYIKDFGIIEKTEINFTAGLNVLSGETGSGKSIVVDAIGVVSGGRALAQYIRSGCQEALIQAAFNLTLSNEITDLLNRNNIQIQKDELLILSRVINNNGRNLCRVNGQMVNLSTFKEIGQRLIDIQGQNEQQLLFSQERQLFILDAYGGEKLLNCRAQVSKLYQQHSLLFKNIEKLRIQNQDAAKEQDLINYQINDIDNVFLSPGEDVELLTERNRLSNIEKISLLVNESYHLINGMSESPFSILDSAGKALKLLDNLAEIDPILTETRAMMASALYQMEESSRNLSQYRDNLEFYPLSLEAVEERLEQITKLKRKYGESIEEILNYRQEIEKKLLEMDNAEQSLRSMEEEHQKIKAALELAAAELSTLRSETAVRLENNITKELAHLKMGGVSFKIIFTENINITESGSEKAEFFISTNPGEPLKPLSKVASGGETSRIMLAIKTILAETEDIPTLIFDEIDTGIGGKTIWSLGQKLSKLAENRQIISITHSSPLASLADNHLLICKCQMKDKTFAHVITLDENGRLKELTRMLGGTENDRTALDHARELLNK